MDTITIERAEIGMDDEEDDETDIGQFHGSSKLIMGLSVGLVLSALISGLSWYLYLQYSGSNNSESRVEVSANSNGKRIDSENSAVDLPEKAPNSEKEASNITKVKNPAEKERQIPEKASVPAKPLNQEPEKALTVETPVKRSPLQLDRPAWRAPIKELQVDRQARRVRWRSQFYTCIMMPGGDERVFVPGVKQGDWWQADLPAGSDRYNFVSICHYNTYWAIIPGRDSHLGQPVVRGKNGARSYSLLSP
jgi:hypothetical protein